MPDWTPGTLIPHKPVQHHHGGTGGSFEWFPDFAQIATVQIDANVRWSEFFSAGGPVEGDIVLIPPGVTVIYDQVSTQRFKAIVVWGRLEFDPAINTTLKVGTIVVESPGVLQIAPDNRTVISRVIFSGPLDTNEDPIQFGSGLVTNGGTVEVLGTAPSNVFVKSVANAGTAVFSTEVETGWFPGDTIVFPDQQLGTDPAHWSFPTRYAPQTEKKVVASVSGTSVTLTSPLQYHHGASWSGVLNRNVIFQTESGSPRAHILFSGHAVVNFRNAEIIDMGRTTIAERDDTTMSATGTPIHVGLNQRARYALHAHHVHEPVVFIGNSIHGLDTLYGSDRFGIVLHDSRGEISGNIVVGARGSAVFLEDGVETGEVSGNLVLGIGGGTGLGDDVRFSPLQGQDMGAGGFGIWARGTLVNIHHNVAVGYFSQAAYAFFTHSSFVSGIIPNIPGNPPELISGPPIALGQMPIQAYGAFADNTAQGFSRHAMEISYQQTAVGTVLQNNTLKLLNSDGVGIHVNHCNEIVLENQAIIGVGNFVVGAFNNSGANGKLTVQGGFFSNMYIGIPTFPKGGQISGVIFQSNLYNVAMVGGSGLVDLIGYSGGNFRLYSTAQSGSITLPGVYGHAVPIP